MKIDLSGKTAVVTGASGELGRAMVRTLADCGADVAVHYLNNKQQADALVAQVASMDCKAIAVQGDVTSGDDVARMCDDISSALGAADIIVNNAVIQYPWTSVLEQGVADYESQFRSCVLHNVLMAKTFVPAMIEKKWGRVIAINTECAMQNTESQSAYVSGKRGMDGVLRVLAREVGQHGITVNQVAPGWTVSENRPDSDDPFVQQYRDKIPLRRRGTAQEIANAVVFLASDLASYITGVFLPVCGGNTMGAI
jgi:3-oxoacyl-[acyl-carrier protein] reductase